MVRLVDIERKVFQFVFFNENETERIGVNWDVKKLTFLGENPGRCMIKWRKFCRNLQTNWKMNE